MMSPNNDVLDLKYYNEPIPVNHPLTEYYCYSSHNTYLTGNQLTSDSKAERYNQDLENGLRCVEIDVHVHIFEFRMGFQGQLSSMASQQQLLSISRT